MIKKSTLQIFTFIFALCCIASSVNAQKPPIHPGIALYREGKFDQAIASLEQAKTQPGTATNAEIWNTLGLAYYASDQIEPAKTALEKAIKLDPDSSAFHSNLGYVYLLLRRIGDARNVTNKAIRLNPRNTNAYFTLGRVSLWEGDLDEAEKNAIKIGEINGALPEGYILRSQILMRRLGQRVYMGWDIIDEIDLIKQAVNVLGTGIERCRAHPNLVDLTEEYRSLSALLKFVTEQGDRSGEAVSAPIQVNAKLRPKYNAAKLRGAEGTAQIAALIGSDGKVKYAFILDGLGYGLDEQSIEAVKQLKFEPAMVSGKVSDSVRTIEYHVRLY